MVSEAWRLQHSKNNGLALGRVELFLVQQGGFMDSIVIVCEKAARALCHVTVLSVVHDIIAV